MGAAESSDGGGADHDYTEDRAHAAPLPETQAPGGGQGKEENDHSADAKSEGATPLTGDDDIILQAFHWESHNGAWWRELKEKVPDIAALGFTALWLPPASDSLAPQGYLPKDLYNLDSAYGSEGELRDLLGRLRQRGLQSIADVVINHRIGSTQGEGGAYNRYDGMPMPWTEAAVTSDTGGTGNASTGENFDGAPNIDHTNDGVRADLIAWLRWLRDDVGFDGFRFDFAKGYSPGYVKQYVEVARPRLAVGEFWDACNYEGADYKLAYDQDSHRQRIADWVGGTGHLAAAFDFTTKGILQDVVERGEYWRLKDPRGQPPGLLGILPSHAVTFVENHDTGSTQNHWPFPKQHILQGYAYILTHPGTPTVFYDHVFSWGDDVRGGIQKLIEARKRAKVGSRSAVRICAADGAFYAAEVGASLAVRMGGGDWAPPEPGPWELAAAGDGYSVWLKPQGTPAA